MSFQLRSQIAKQIEEDRRRYRRGLIILRCGLGLFFALLIGVCVYAVRTNLDARHRFMSQCMEDHKEYECTALWRAGSSEPPTIIYVPVTK
jgi:hypothetical protein